MKHRFFLHGFTILFLIMLSGCGGGTIGEKLSTEKPERVVNRNVTLAGENVGGLHESELLQKLGEYGLKTNIGAVNAVVDGKTWKVSSEKAGRKLNVEKTMPALLGAREGGSVDYVVETVQPQVSAAQLRKNITVIAAYTTPLLNRSDSRVNNIDIASNRIDYKILEPGEEFSFNKTVGRRSPAKGYEEAPIIVMTPEGPKKKKAPGGGVCQISTTIYNAVEECKLKVTERHIHSKDIGYVPRGEDATVSYGTVDFRFINSRSNPVMLRLFLNSKSLTVKILENRNSGAAIP